MRKLIFILPVLLLLFMQKDRAFVLPPECGSAYADTTSVLATISGYLPKATATWAGSRDAATSGAMVNTFLNTGSSKAAGGNWSVFRSYMSFVLPAIATIDSACLRLDGFINSSEIDTTFNLYAAYYGAALGTDDFQAFDGFASGTAFTGSRLITNWNSSTYSANWNLMPFTAAGEDTLKAYSGRTFQGVMFDDKQYFNTANGDGDSSAVAFTIATAHLWISYTPATASVDGAKGLLRGDVSGGRKW